MCKLLCWKSLCSETWFQVRKESCLCTQYPFLPPNHDSGKPFSPHLFGGEIGAPIGDWNITFLTKIGIQCFPQCPESRWGEESASSHMQGPLCPVHAARPMRGQGQWRASDPVETLRPGVGAVSACESFTVFGPITKETFIWKEYHYISIPGCSCLLW